MSNSDQPKPISELVKLIVARLEKQSPRKGGN